MSKIVVVVPTYNEAENIPKLTTRLLALPVAGVEILVVDDNSPDGTGRLVDELAAADPHIHAMHRAGKLGMGTAYVQGFDWALQNGADIVIQMDADFSHSPEAIPAILDALSGCDVVVGSRYVKGGKLDERWSFWRKLLSWFANSVWVRFILKTPITDSTGGFRAWKRATLIGMNVSQIRSNGYIFQVETTYIAHRLGYKFCEVPIYFEDRRYGTSKMGFAIQLEAAVGVFQLWWRYHGLKPSMRAQEV